jgi:hypothetical protein
MMIVRCPDSMHARRYRLCHGTTDAACHAQARARTRELYLLPDINAFFDDQKHFEDIKWALHVAWSMQVGRAYAACSQGMPFTPCFRPERMQSSMQLAMHATSL